MVQRSEAKRATPESVSSKRRMLLQPKNSGAVLRLAGWIPGKCQGRPHSPFQLRNSRTSDRIY